jgi:ribosomal protein S12 methylthiotransferase accessory factor
MSAAAAAIAGWVAETPLIDGVLFGSSDGEVSGPPVCAVAVAGGLRGYGKGETQSEALASAVGEVLELYAAGRVDAKRLIYASFAELGESAFDPRWLGLYSAEQYARARFPFAPFDPGAQMHWVEGRWIDSGARVYLPAFAVYLADQFAGEALCQVTSNGLAAGDTLSAAVEHAVLELYERDAFLRSWRGLLPKRRVTGDCAGIVAHLAECGAQTEVYLLAEMPVCVAAAVAVGDGVQWPAFTLGLGAARDSDRAVRKAILELGQTSPFLARVWRTGEVRVPAKVEDIQSLQDQALYYCDAKRCPEFELWRQTADGLTTLDQADVRLAVADITPVELQDGPYRVVRALARGLQRVECGYGFDRVVGARRRNDAPCPIC